MRATPRLLRMYNRETWASIGWAVVPAVSATIEVRDEDGSVARIELRWDQALILAQMLSGVPEDEVVI